MIRYRNQKHYPPVASALRRERVLARDAKFIIGAGPGGLGREAFEVEANIQELLVRELLRTLQILRRDPRAFFVLMGYVAIFRS